MAIVYLVGAGPGDPMLLTRRGLQVLAQADVVVYDRLIGSELLDLARADAEKIYVGKAASQHAMQQEDINALLVQRAQNGQNVCRLKGGDPFVFGRGGEEALHCRANGVAFEIVPGVSSSIAAPAYAGIPVTHREVANSFAVVTGHTKDDDAPPPDLPRADTLVFLMGVRALPKIVAQLLARGESHNTPIALVRWGTTFDQQVVSGTLENIEAEVARTGLLPPALIVVGEVVRLRERLQWFDNRALSGQTVIVTRAREQASELVAGLQSHGARVLQCPTIRIESLEDTTVVDDAIAELGRFDWIVFTSSNGVDAFFARCKYLRCDARSFANAQIAAIGPATANALERYGLNADLVPASSISESVAQELIERGVVGKNVLIARAQEGREVLESALRAAGAQVLVAPCYRTVSDNSNAQAAREAIAVASDSAPIWVTFTSSSTVTNLLEALGKEWLQQHRARLRFACIGPITAQTARENGFEPDVMATDASVEALLQVMLQHRADN